MFVITENIMKRPVLQYYNRMGPPSCMRSVVDLNVVMPRIPVFYGVLSGAYRRRVLRSS